MKIVDQEKMLPPEAVELKSVAQQENDLSQRSNQIMQKIDAENAQCAYAENAPECPAKFRDYGADLRQTMAQMQILADKSRDLEKKMKEAYSADRFTAYIARCP